MGRIEILRHEFIIPPELIIKLLGLDETETVLMKNSFNCNPINFSETHYWRRNNEHWAPTIFGVFISRSFTSMENSRNTTKASAAPWYAFWETCRIFFGTPWYLEWSFPLNTKMENLRYNLYMIVLFWSFLWRLMFQYYFYILKNLSPLNLNELFRLCL